MYRIACLHPKIIQNPRVALEVGNYVHAFVDGRCYLVRAAGIEDLLFGKSVCSVFGFSHPESLPLHADAKFAFADSCYFVDSYGERLDMFQCVPCSQCELCRSRYVGSLRQRVMFELQQNRFVPLFVTLTYKPDKQPLRGPDVRAIQLFKKRLKQTVSRHFHFDSSTIKFLTTSEFGAGGNLHYHMLVLGMPLLSSNVEENQKLRYHLFQYCWRQPEFVMLTESKTARNPISFSEYRRRYPLIFKRPKDYDPFSYGFVNVQSADKGNRCVNYITKYITKNFSEKRSHLLVGYSPVTHKKYLYRPRLDERGLRPHFCIASQNLGVEFAKTLPVGKDGTVTFHNWLDNRIYVVTLCGYFVNKIYPSMCRLVPPIVRRAYLMALDDIAKLLVSVSSDKTLYHSLLATSVYLRTAFPFQVDFPAHYDGYVVRPDTDEFEQLLRDIGEKVSICYKFILETDFDDIRRSIVDRDRYFSLLKLRNMDALPSMAFAQRLQNAKIISKSKL